MSRLDLLPPDWDAVIGGNAAEEQWLVDRERKLEASHRWADDLIQVQRALQEHGSEFQCSPEVLGSIPLAATWYVSLLGFAQTTLGNIKSGPQSFGLKQKPASFVEALRKGIHKKPSELIAFSNWVNSQIAQTWPDGKQQSSAALAVVSMIIGGRIIGAGQNAGGLEAVNLVKSLFVNAMQTAGCSIEIKVGDEWKTEYETAELSAAKLLRFGANILCDLTPGGDRPDIVLKNDTDILAVGEIKGRKDGSNTWESWMPGVTEHITTWTNEYPNSERLLFGTVVTQEMVDGGRACGVARGGLKQLYDQDKLTGAFNIVKISSGDRRARDTFDDLISKLCTPT